MSRSLLVLLSIACAGPAPVADAGTDAAMPSIMEPALPVLTPCPPGWAEATVGGVVVCDPTPGGAIDCEDGEARFPGSAACEPVGRTCPAGEFAAGLPRTGVLYVRPGGSGDGTLAAPLGTIAAALAAASPGTTIALAKGTYDEALPMRSGVTVRGACAAETILQWSTPRRPSGSIGAAAGVTGAVVADLTVRRSDNVGARVHGELRLEGVVIEEAMLFGVLVTGGRLESEGLLVRATRTDNGAQGGGALATDGGALSLTRAVFTENHQYGVAVAADSRAELTDVASRAQVIGATPGLAAGIMADSGGVLIGRRIELTGALGAAALSLSGGIIELSDGVVRGTRAGDRQAGVGLGTSGGVIRASRVWLDAQQGTAVSSVREGELVLSDVIISGTVAPPLLPGSAVGIEIAERGDGALERVLVQGGMTAGVFVRGLEGDAFGETSLRATDLIVRDIVDEGSSGLGAYIAAADAELSRVAIERATEAALVADGAHLRLRHARISDTRSDPLDGRWGRGLEVFESDAEIEHARFEGNREVGLIFNGGRAQLSRVEVLDTRERSCAESTCSGEPGGIGIGVYGEAQVSVADFTIDGAPLCGVQIALDGQLDLSEGVIRNASIGACVQVEGYDVTRLARGVAYRETGTSIQTTSHWVPDTFDPMP